MSNASETFFTRHCRLIQAPVGSDLAAIPFKDHAQFAVMTDILARKEQHHIALLADYFNKLAPAFLDGFALYLKNEHIPRTLQNAQLIYLDIDDLLISKSDQPLIDHDFERLLQTLDSSDKYCFFIVPALAWLAKSGKVGDQVFLHKHLKTLSAHPHCRMIALTNPKDFRQHHLNDCDLELIRLEKLADHDVLAILKLQRDALESFHHVGISDELLLLAYSMTQRYISTSDTLFKALLMLDSAAARANTVTVNDDTLHLQPALSLTHLLSVVSTLTKIPASHLLPTGKHSHEITQALHQFIYGQDAALSLISTALPKPSTERQHSTAPLGAFLFAGPTHTGKITTAITLTTQLFQQTNMLYFAQPVSSTTQTLADLCLQPFNHHHFLTLREVIQQTPHAVIVYENIDQAPSIIIEGFLDIFRTGFLHDVGGQCHDFRQSLLIFTTTLGSQRLTDIAKTIAATDDAHHADLMQLIMHEKKHDELVIKPHYSPQELTREIAPILKAALPAVFCQQVSIVPFLPLHKAAVEKIIRLKLNKMAKQLYSQSGIDLSYAPEIIRYFIKEALIEQETHSLVINLDQLLKPLRLLIEQALMIQTNNARSTQLFIQLNETGELLQYEWQSTTPIRQHAT